MGLEKLIKLVENGNYLERLSFKHTNDDKYNIGTVSISKSQFNKLKKHFGSRLYGEFKKHPHGDCEIYKLNA